jgi:hypothetical protein
LQRLQLLLQRIDLPLHLIGLGILRERRRRHEDRRENRTGQQQPCASFEDHLPSILTEAPAPLLVTPP